MQIDYSESYKKAEQNEIQVPTSAIVVSVSSQPVATTGQKKES